MSFYQVVEYEDPGTPASGGLGVGVGYPFVSHYGTAASQQLRDPEVLVLHSFKDEQEALRACQEEWDAFTKSKVKKQDKQALAQR